MNTKLLLNHRKRNVSSLPYRANNRFCHLINKYKASLKPQKKKSGSEYVFVFKFVTSARILITPERIGNFL